MPVSGSSGSHWRGTVSTLGGVSGPPVCPCGVSSGSRRMPVWSSHLDLPVSCRCLVSRAPNWRGPVPTLVGVSGPPVCSYGVSSGSRRVPVWSSHVDRPVSCRCLIPRLVLAWPCSDTCRCLWAFRGLVWCLFLLPPESCLVLSRGPSRLVPVSGSPARPGARLVLSAPAVVSSGPLSWTHSDLYWTWLLSWTPGPMPGPASTCAVDLGTPGSYRILAPIVGSSVLLVGPSRPVGVWLPPGAVPIRLARACVPVLWVDSSRLVPRRF